MEVPTNPPVNNIGEKFGNLKNKLLQRVTENNAIANDVSANVVLKNDQKDILYEIFDLELLSLIEEVLKKYEKDISQMTSYLQVELRSII